MAFTIYHSNHLDSLQYMASHLIRQHPLANPLLPEYFIIHSSGMTNWLKSTLAEELDIFANMRLEFPINQIVTIVEELLTEGEKAQTNLRISRLTLTWSVYDLLKNLENLDEFAVLQKYLSQNSNMNHDNKVMSLAESIAGLFDRYLAYRPDWLNAWDDNQNILIDSVDEDWQKKIWRSIRPKIIPKYYLANIIELLKNLPAERFHSSKIPKRLSIIGISTLPPLFIDLLHSFSEHMDVHLFFTNPSQFYWGDLTQYRNKSIKRIVFETQDYRENLLAPSFNEQEWVLDDEFEDQWLEFNGNPFLANFGKIGRDFLHLFSQFDDVNEIEAFSEPETDGLLGQIHKEIFNLAPIDANREKYRVGERDKSLTFHSHYSERREVEGLYDQLLHMFNEDKTLEPRDIIVMVADIDRYRPMIEAVFGSSPAQEMMIPFTISDFTLGKNEPILEAFLRLLSINESYFSASELLTLLEIPEIAERFNITIDDRQVISRWVTATNIKFGINDAHLKDLHIREDFTNTWLWGLKRLLLGYGCNEPVEIDDVLVFPHVHGSEAIILGNLVDFVDALIDLKEFLEHSKTLQEWDKVLANIWASFYIDEEETNNRLQYLASIWSKFINEGIALGIDEPISIHLIQRHLTEHLSSFRPASRFLTGSVNFCTFVPMRSIPFKVVCMLGMNQESFPSRHQSPDYDLMQVSPRRGDRSVINDERYLFLEAILSAQKRLYISYIGKNIHNNSEMFPSLFVNELQHYIDEIARIDSHPSVIDALTIQHPLSPFSPLLFTENSPIQSFQKEWLPSSVELKHDVYHSKVEHKAQISVNELMAAYKDPLKAFSAHHFGINFYQKNSFDIEDDELFALSSLDGLEKYNARLNLLIELFQNDIGNELLPEYARQQLFMKYRLEGKLPKFAFAQLDWNSFSEPIVQLALAAKDGSYAYGQAHYIRVTSDDVVIEGVVEGSQAINQSRVFVGDFNLRRQFDVFITHILNTVHLHKEIITTVYYFSDKKNQMTALRGITVDSAQNILQALVNGYQENLVDPYLLSTKRLFVTKKSLALLEEHKSFILDNYGNYSDALIRDYCAQHSKFETDIFNKVFSNLEGQSSGLIDRFIGEVTLKHAMNYLYFYINYESLMVFDPAKDLKMEK